MSLDNIGRSEVMEYVKKRVEEFERLGKEGRTVFNFRPFLDLKLKANVKTELAFCISTANSSALSGLKFQKSLEDLNLDNLSVDEIEGLMRSAGVRFARRKAYYVKEALERFEIIERALSMNDFEARKTLLKIKGFGMKESSHFLRNLGRKNVAIVDRHVLRWLSEKGYSFKLPRDYVKAELALSVIAEGMGLTLAELDLLIWFEMTGKVLK